MASQLDGNQVLKESFDDDKLVLHVGGKTAVITITPTLDTGIHASGDTLFNAVEAADVFATVGGTGTILSVSVRDAAGQSGALDVLVFNAAPTTRTLNAASAYTSADLAKQVNFVSVLAANYGTIGTNLSFGEVGSVGKGVKAAAASTSLWIAGISRDAKTYAANSLTITVTILLD